MTRQELEDYVKMQGYVHDLEKKQARLEKEMRSLEKRISEIESGEIVVDKVKGGEGGIQNFRIEGIPTVELREKKARLMLKKLSYAEVCDNLQEQTKLYLAQMLKVELFIIGIEDVHVKRIVNLRFVECMNWNEVADCIGGRNTEDSVKKAYYRYMDSINA